jgi:hypothetical protein
MLLLRVLSCTCCAVLCCADRWHDAGSQTINFITELFTSGTLRQ